MQLEDPRIRYRQLQNEHASTESIPLQTSSQVNIWWNLLIQISSLIIHIIERSQSKGRVRNVVNHSVDILKQIQNTTHIHIPTHT